MAVSVDLIDALKRCLRAQELTYRELAARIRMSEAAVKRMFSRRAMSLQRLEQICEVLDVGLAELTGGGFAINLHKSQQEIGIYTACGNI